MSAYRAPVLRRHAPADRDRVALACGPRLLVADEPTTALDVTVQAGIIRLLDRLRRETGLAIVFITHDLGVLSAIADRVAVFYAGRVVEAGSRTDVLGRPRHPYTRGLLDALPHPEASATAARRRPRGAARAAARAARLRVPPALPLRARGAAGPPFRRSFRWTDGRSPAPSTPCADDRVARARAGRGRRRVRAARASAPSVPSPARASPSDAARSSASSASRDAASRRSPVPPSAWSHRSPGRSGFEGREVRPLTRRARPRELARLQMVFQNPFSSLNPRRRVGDQIGDALDVLGVASRAKRRARVAELLEQVGLPAGCGARLSARVLAAGNGSASRSPGRSRQARR